MASPNFATYARYKSMQDDFANFLGQTGRLCKAPSHLLQEPEDPQKKDATPQPTPDGEADGKTASGRGRLKGKARKLARAKEDSKGKTKSEVVKTYKLYIKNYIPLAQHVAESKSVHSIIPTWIINTLTSIIRDREEILNHYNGTDAESSAFSDMKQFKYGNDKHAHMISVLKRVRVILGAKHRDDEQLQAAKAAKRSNRHSKTSKSEPVNKFPQHLNTDEDEIEEDGAVDDKELEKQRETDATAWKAAAAAKTSVQFEADVDVSFADAVQALMGLCKEWHHMRDEVKQAWRGYVNGSVDLGAAAIMANTAIDLARNLEEAVLPVVARNDEICRHGIWKDFANHLSLPKAPAKNIYSGLYTCLLSIRPTVPTTSASRSTNFYRWRREQAETSVFKDYLFMDSFQLLEALHNIASLDAQTSNESLVSELQNSIEVYEAAFDQILNISQDLMELNFLGSNTPRFHLDFVDEVSRAMCMHKEEPDFRLWPVFAWELFKDAKELLNPLHPSQAFDELQEFVKAGSRLLSDIKIGYAGNNHPSEYPQEVDDLLRDVFIKTESLQVDWFEDFYKSCGPIPGDLGGNHREPFRLVRRHPIFCGLALQSIRLRMHEVGSKLARSGMRAVTNMAHLYNLCHVDVRTTKGGSDFDDWALANAWKDMERLVISSQPHNVFIGGQAPTTRSECCKNFALVKGIPWNYLNTSLRCSSGPGPMGPTSLKDFMRDMKRGGKVMSKRKIVSFLGDDLQYPVSDNFTSRLTQQDDRRDFTITDLCQILERSQEKESVARPKRRTAITTHQIQPSALLVDLLNRLNQEAAMLKSCSPRLFLDCLHLAQDIENELKAHVNVGEFFEWIGIAGKHPTPHGKQPELSRIYAVLSGRFDLLPIVRAIIMKWLKSKGGNGAMLFPKPPHANAS